ncbi:MAG: right-handed parallel beta-helix repeat-containing protein [Armatimonadetes bacterium]|nr:right-handed parallel beta-helix repeat-containing protein [Armatimonadota bacterium]
MIKMRVYTLICLGLLTMAASNTSATILLVGEGKAFTRIEAAYEAAKPGDTILIRPLPNGRAYEGVALSVSKPNITFLGSEGDTVSPSALKPSSRPILSGKGLNYTGVGRTPRAVLQFNASAKGCRVENLEIFGAHNDSHNGAAIRINEANDTTIQLCDLHHNDMGIMSNGSVERATGVNQVIEGCHIHHNGDLADPGYNHNLYMGGTSVIVLDCEIDHSLTGHNFKSRAHYNWLGRCYIHDSANREVDLVDEKGNTTAANSHTVIVACIIAKAMEQAGNHTVIHWGQDGGNDHDGTLHLCHNTIITPYQSPVVDMNAPSAKLDMMYNLITDGGRFQNGQVLVQVSSGAKEGSISGFANVAARGFTDKMQCNLTQTSLMPNGKAVRFTKPELGDYTVDMIPAPLWLKVPHRALPAHLPLLTSLSEQVRKAYLIYDPTEGRNAIARQPFGTPERFYIDLIGAKGMAGIID